MIIIHIKSINWRPIVLEIEEEDIEEMENCEIGMLPNCDIMEKT